MNFDHRKTSFLETIRAALGKPLDDAAAFEERFPDQRTTVRANLVRDCRLRPHAERLELLATLIERAGPLNIQVEALPDARAVATAIRTLVQTTEPEWGDAKMVAAWSHPLVASLDLAARLEEIGVPLVTVDADGDPLRMRQAVRESYIGITAADHCVADTATLVMTARPGEARSVSLVPSIHVAVITLGQIVRDLEELYALLKAHLGPGGEGLGGCTTFISGPSKTADIELTMVHGAHGPRALHLFVITG